MDIKRRAVLAAGALAAGFGAADAGASQISQTDASQATPTSAASGRGGLIAMEEACIPNKLFAEWEAVLGSPYAPGWKEMLTDFTGKRLREMDAGGIDISVMAVTVPGPQFVADPAKAAAMAKRANDALAEELAKRPDRFIGFAALSMHDPDQAIRELERAIKDLRMRGVLLYNFQRTGADGNGALFYDDRRFDPFWATLERLDVPLYLHPGVMTKSGSREQDLHGFDWLKDASWGFAVNTGLHALRIMTSGVFDRHPKAQLVLGHNGEHIVYDMWRIDNRLKLRSLGLPAKKTVREYFKSNVHVTTSGEFSSPGLRHVIEEIGSDRVMFAVDYPYESNEPATTWFHSAPLSEQERAAIGRGNAARLLKLT